MPMLPAVTAPPPAAWCFVDPTALPQALGDSLPFDNLQTSSSPSLEEAASRTVLDGLGQWAQQSGLNPPMALFVLPPHPTLPWLIHEWWATVVVRPQDGAAIMMAFPRQDEDDLEQTVQRRLRLPPGGMVHGVLSVGRLGPDGTLSQPWRTVGVNLLHQWSQQPSGADPLRAALLSLAHQVPNGVLPHAFQAWEGAHLRAALDASPILAVAAPPRRL